MLWINFLHLYHPDTIEAPHIHEAAEKSYFRVIGALEDNPHVKFTMNISGCLAVRFERLGLSELLVRIKKLVDKGQIELVGTASHHPLLPLIKEEEARKQIKENEKILQSYFGRDFKPAGFFLPEMAYSPKIANLVKSLGYQYLVLDEITGCGKLNQLDCSKAYEDADTGLKTVFRLREISRSYVPETLLKEIGHERTIMTATDCELYGLRHNDPHRFFETLISRPDLKTLTISEFIAEQQTERITLVPSNWDSTEKELEAGVPYALWNDPKNDLHAILWKLANLAQDCEEKFAKDLNKRWSRWHLERGLSSCAFWWASGRDFRLFGPITWNPDVILKGAEELIRSIRSIDDITSKEIKLEAEKLYLEIIRLTWNYHWTKFWRK